MKIEDFKHINVLMKLLGKIRYSDRLDSDDIDFYATSPLIVEIHEQLKNEWINQARDKGLINESDIDNMIFEFDSHVGQMLRNRIDNWDSGIIETARKWTDEEIEEYTILMIKPLKYTTTELNRLKKYINDKIN